MPYPRQVTQTLASALRATQSALRGQNDKTSADSVHRAVAEGVSANFCEAIAGMLDEVEGAPAVDLEVAWALRLPQTKEREPFHLAQRDAPVLEEAARLLREESPFKGILITGSLSISIGNKPKSRAKSLLAYSKRLRPLPRRLRPVEVAARSARKTLLEAGRAVARPP